MNLNFFLSVGLLGLFILTALVIIMMLRLVRKQRSIDKRLGHLRVEVEQLLQAEERRAMAEAKTNKNFLSGISLQIVDSGPTAPETFEDPKKAPDHSDVSDINQPILHTRSR
jgi:hypothetical protein